MGGGGGRHDAPSPKAEGSRKVHVKHISIQFVKALLTQKYSSTVKANLKNIRTYNIDVLTIEMTGRKP